MSSAKEEMKIVTNWYNGELKALEEQRENIVKMYEQLINKIRDDCNHPELLSRSGQYTSTWICADCGKEFDTKPKTSGKV